MIGQYLSNTNEKATVSILQNILELNKALGGLEVGFDGAILGLEAMLGYFSRFMKNGIPQIQSDKRSTVFGPVSVYPIKNKNKWENTVYGCG